MSEKEYYDEGKAYSKALECFSKADHTRAQYDSYDQGQDLRKFYLKAAEKNDPDACYKLATFYIEGSVDIALTYLNKAIRQNHADSMYTAALLYQEGNGVEKNLSKSLKYLVQASKFNHVDACIALGKRYELGLGVFVNIKKSIHWYTMAASKNSAKANYQLGMLYKGYRLKKDIEKAHYFLIKAAEQDYPDAYYELGNLYHEPGGLEREYFAAYQNYYRAVFLGHIAAHNAVGYCYHYNHGGHLSYTEAASYYKLAGEKGYVTAAYNLGILYRQRGKWNWDRRTLLLTSISNEIKDYKEAMRWFRTAVDSNFIMANNGIAMLYAFGQGVSKNYKTALHYYNRCGNVDSMIGIGQLYQWGDTFPQDTAKAIKYFKAAAKDGNTLAMFYIGACYRDGGTNVAKNHKEAYKWFKKAADKDHPDACFQVGLCISKGQGVRKDTKVALEWFFKGADLGHGRSYQYIGFCYLYGEGLEKNYHEAHVSFAKAVYFNHVPSCFNVGYSFQNGLDPERGGKDMTEAFKWYIQGAEGGHMESQVVIARWYYYGHTVEQDIAEAVRWFKKTASNGDAESLYYLGHIYRKGKGVDQDYEKALGYLVKSAAKEHVYGIHELGVMYYYGFGVKRDISKALELFKKSAAKGHVHSPIFIGKAYYLGLDGLQKYQKEAMKWFQKTIDSGDEQGKEFIKDICNNGAEGDSGIPVHGDSTVACGYDLDPLASYFETEKLPSINQLVSEQDKREEMALFTLNALIN